MGRLRQMQAFIQEADDIIAKEVHFMEGFPHDSLLEADANALISEADLLVASQV